VLSDIQTSIWTSKNCFVKRKAEAGFSRNLNELNAGLSPRGHNYGGGPVLDHRGSLGLFSGSGLEGGAHIVEESPTGVITRKRTFKLQHGCPRKRQFYNSRNCNMEGFEVQGRQVFGKFANKLQVVKGVV
jgi:hypothetical protein